MGYNKVRRVDLLKHWIMFRIHKIAGLAAAILMGDGADQS